MNRIGPDYVMQPTHVYEIRLCKDHRGVDLISDVLPFGRLWSGEPDAVGYAKFRSRSHDAVIRVYDEAGNVIETHEQAGEFRELVSAERGKGPPTQRSVTAPFCDTTFRRNLAVRQEFNLV
jgi:hypothetical protein